MCRSSIALVLIQVVLIRAHVAVGSILVLGSRMSLDDVCIVSAGVIAWKVLNKPKARQDRVTLRLCKAWIYQPLTTATGQSNLINQVVAVVSTNYKG